MNRRCLLGSLMFGRIILSGALILVGAEAMAQDASENNFVRFKTGEALDDKCHYLRQFERNYLYDIEENLLAPLPFFIAHEAGELSNEQYRSQYDALAARGRDAAAAIDCADEAAAGPLVLPLRGEIGVGLYGDLMIAFQHGELTDEQKRAAQTYEQIIAPLFSQNWEAFVQTAAAKAQAKIEEAIGKDDCLNYYRELGVGLGSLPEELDYLCEGNTYNLDLLVENATKITDDIIFETAVERSGYRWITQLSPTTYHFREQLTDPAFVAKWDLWEIPGRYEALDLDVKFQAVFAVDTAGAVRVMTFGERADAMANGTVIFKVHPPLGPEVTDSFAYNGSQEWWDKAERLEAIKVDEPCLGGPCFSLPPDILAAIAASPTSQPYRFVFKTDPASSDPAMENPRVNTGYGYRLNYRMEMVAQGL